VGQAYRRRGIGAQLVRRIMLEAGRLKVPLLYLYTVHSENFYTALGWTLLARTTYRDQNVVLMTYKPVNDQP
jgi:N-acetylglutamate synthase-like GNAT family acetyltransferase